MAGNAGDLYDLVDSSWPVSSPKPR